MYFFNANVIFKGEVGEEFIPTKRENGLVAVEHPGFINEKVKNFTYENNEKSLAYIDKNLNKEYKYVCGGLNGGKKEEFLKLIKELDKRIKKDLENNIIAVWHDESHFNRYIFELDNKVKILDDNYAYPEDWDRNKNSYKILLRDKNKLGGHSYLRGING